ncbi:MAG: mechanosensitive ion channel domain-containing protein [Pseudomonadota bacterium]
MRTFLKALFFAVTVFLFSAITASSQTLPFPGTSETQDSEAVTLPDPLTREAIRDVLSGLSDSAVRTLLLQELERQVEEREEALRAETEEPFHVTARELTVALGVSLYEPVLLAPTIIPALQDLVGNFLEMRGGASLWRLPGFLILSILGGIAGVLIANVLLRKTEARILEQKPETFWARIGTVFFRFFMQAIRIGAFLIGGALVNEGFNGAVPADQTLVRILGSAVGWTALAVMIARFMLSPQRPDLRLCHVDNEAAWFLTWRIGLIFGWSAFTLGTLFSLTAFGWVLGETRFGFWLNIIFVLLVIQTIWQGRKAIAGMVAGPGDVSGRWRRFSNIWPYVAIGLVLLQWLVVELVVATGNLHLLSLTTMNITLVIVLTLPLLEHSIPALVRGSWPAHPDATETDQKVTELLQESAIRCAHLVMLFFVIWFLAELWGVSVLSVVAQRGSAELASSLTAIFLTIVFSFAVLEFVSVATKRKMILERAALEEKDPTSAAYGLTRLETVLPLIRGVIRVIVIVLAFLAILAQLGINIIPLLAGAGVAGIAIGFGAQALVRDIISGIFFLIDDAFRKDEYIDIGTCMGTVEKLSIRSMQIRHHDGLLNTVPFGEIKQVTNYSRDWGIMRLHLRVPYDTDVVRLATLINELGEQLLEDPEVGDKFTHKLTSQGVIDTDDSALIFRVAYMTKALDQWAMRGQVYAKIREMFDREGIKFAAREVTVRVTGDEENGDDPDRRKSIAAAARSVIEEEKIKS